MKRIERHRDMDNGERGRDRGREERESEIDGDGKIVRERDIVRVRYYFFEIKSIGNDIM